jgi:hypothetical protein
MRPFKNSIVILSMIFCVSISSMAKAGILWEKDLVLDANTNSAPLASCLNKDGNGVIVMTAESPKGSFPIKGDSVFWEIGAEGNVIRVLPKNADGSKVWTNADPIGYGCAIASDNLGNLLTVGILHKQEDEKGQKVAVVSKTDKAEKIISPRNPIEHHSVKKMISLQDNTFALVGDRNGHGLYSRIDNQGRIIQEKLFDMGKNEICTDVEQIKSDNLSLAIVGVSFKISVKDPNENFAEDFISICDSNLSAIYEEHFAGGLPGLLFPKVCCLDNGNIIVFYKIKSEYPKTILWARCYTKELKLLWEKEIFAADKMPFFFDVVSRRTGGFVAWIGQVESLEFYFLDNTGNEINHIQYKGSVAPGGSFGSTGFNLLRINDEIIAVFKEGTPGNIKECSIKTKAIALD